MSSWEDRRLSLALSEADGPPWTTRFTPAGLLKVSGYVSAALWSGVAWAGMVKLVLTTMH